MKQTKKATKKPDSIWLNQPEAQDYPAALSYLNLIYDDATGKAIVEKLKKAPVKYFKAKDIFRASRLPLLSVENYHVKKDGKKIKKKEKISPLLLVRDSKNEKLIIADGYHRMCAVYTNNEDIVVPCKIV